MYIQPWQMLNHYEVLWILISTFNYLLLSIICQHNYHCIMKIIYNMTMICLFSKQKPLNVELIFTKKNHSGPAMPWLYGYAWPQQCIANMHGAFQWLNCQLSPYGAVVTCRTATNNWKQIKLRHFTAIISHHELNFPLRKSWFVVPNPLLISR